MKKTTAERIYSFYTNNNNEINNTSSKRFKNNLQEVSRWEKHTIVGRSAFIIPRCKFGNDQSRQNNYDNNKNSTNSINGYNSYNINTLESINNSEDIDRN